MNYAKEQILKRYPEKLATKLSDQEQLHLGREAGQLAHRITQQAVAVEVAKERHKEEKDDLTKLERSRDEKLDALRTGEIFVETEMHEVVTPAGNVAIIRTDTGQTMRERALEADERQLKLPGMVKDATAGDDDKEPLSVEVKRWFAEVFDRDKDRAIEALEAEWPEGCTLEPKDDDDTVTRLQVIDAATDAELRCMLAAIVAGPIPHVADLDLGDVRAWLLDPRIGEDTIRGWLQRELGNDEPRAVIIAELQERLRIELIQFPELAAEVAAAIGRHPPLVVLEKLVVHEENHASVLGRATEENAHDLINGILSSASVTSLERLLVELEGEAESETSEGATSPDMGEVAAETPRPPDPEAVSGDSGTSEGVAEQVCDKMARRKQGEPKRQCTRAAGHRGRCAYAVATPNAPGLRVTEEEIAVNALVDDRREEIAADAKASLVTTGETATLTFRVPEGSKPVLLAPPPSECGDVEAGFGVCVLSKGHEGEHDYEDYGERD